MLGNGCFLLVRVLIRVVCLSSAISSLRCTTNKVLMVGAALKGRKVS